MLVYVNDKPVAAAAIVRDGRALLPLRAIAESLGASVSYDPRTRIVTVRRTAMQLTLTPQIIGTRAYVPLRSLAEWFGARVVYDAQNRVVRVSDAYAYGSNQDAPASAFTTPAPVPPPTLPYGGNVTSSVPFSFFTQNASAFYPGDWMDFVLVAPPGGSASLQLCNIGYHYTMQSYGQDRYEVRVPAPTGFNIPNCLVSAWYTSWTGQTTFVPVPLYIGLYTAPRGGWTTKPTPPPTPAPHPSATPLPPPRPESTPTPRAPTPAPVPVHTHAPVPIEHTPRPLPPAPVPKPKPSP